ncbi:MAG: DNA/RNA nuclease SfsA [Desulfobacteraceae bacterium]|nr:DNA/RNA nuclease SfsA [Desulfobacteraceae bacterium]
MVKSPNKTWSSLLWPPLIKGTLIKRYKRFLADVVLADGCTVTAHCPNSGSMAECNLPGAPVYLSQHDDPKRKLKYTWELIQMPTSLVGVNTLVPNRLVALAAKTQSVPALAGYDQVQTEVKIDAHTRLDLKLSGAKRTDCFVEVKNCTLVKDGLALFPDARTIRGQKHLQTLAQLKAQGHRALMFFVVQRSDARRFAPAEAIDPEYSRALRQVAAQGVEIVVYDVAIDLKGIALNRVLPYELKD